MVVFFFSPFLLAVFILFAVGLAYEAYITLHGVIVIIAMLLFVVEVIVGIIALLAKAEYHRNNSNRTTKWHVVMSLIASMLHLYTSYLVLRDIRSYGDGIFDMIAFVFGLMICGALWLYSLLGWTEALADDGFNYRGFLREVIVAAILVFLVFIW